MEPGPNSPEKLKRLQNLLTLKRHELPPPSYFERLPRSIRGRIDQMQARPARFWQRWLEAWDMTPALTTTYAAVAVVLLFTATWLRRPPEAVNEPQLVKTPPVETNYNPVLITSNTPPSGLFNPPSLQVQPASAPKH
ncbi:MAG: hypothetical protein FJ406_01870 [Verrucomicrobia bacterium]|nr:hypothetical protein [Verrucomicrobiota bacterium]